MTAAALRRQRDDFRREAVALLESVGDDELDRAPSAVRPRTPTAHAVAPSQS